MNSNTQYTAAIIGAGRIGSLFDSPTSDEVLTHAHAFSENTNIELVALVDTDSVRGKAEAEKWDTSYFENVENMAVKIKPEIIIIATPDDTHISMLQEAINLQPKLIVCEKPIQLSAEDGKYVSSIETTIPIVVNYRRRFDPTVITLRNSILNGEVGEVIGATGIFSGGFLHNGSHLIDLARFLFGEMVSCASGSLASFEKCQNFHILESTSSTFSIFELDILTEKGRFRFIDEGLRLQTQEVVDDSVFDGYSILGPVIEGRTELMDSMKALASHCVDLLEGEGNNISPLSNALKTEEACFKILAS